MTDLFLVDLQLFIYVHVFGWVGELLAALVR